MAIKFLLDDAGPDTRGAFKREAQMLSQVTDVHVARLHRLVESDQGIALVMEPADVVSLKPASPPPEAALIALKGSLLGLAAHGCPRPGVVVGESGDPEVDQLAAPIRRHHDIRGLVVAKHTPTPCTWPGEPASPAIDVYSATCVFSFREEHMCAESGTFVWDQAITVDLRSGQVTGGPDILIPAAFNSAGNGTLGGRLPAFPNRSSGLCQSDPMSMLPWSASSSSPLPRR